ncbi:expressed unknown protein [Seminavis robusta]|uniref:Uncharacterized protein n=1 Tax=Seminavis robusta TaxID=568900 RepID=A0A9N8HP70_9STRA|nr:expressed unknown protein [Seminavis robusta]|eukprot:Sro1295_g260270.1 n/a (410) ;mRNA; r:17273-18502
MFATSKNEIKKSEFEAMLEKHGLSHCYTALKGSEGAVQLQHVMNLKKIAVQEDGEAALAKALGEAGVVSVEDQKSLAVLLRKQIEERGGLPMKPVEAATLEGDTAAWKAGIAKEDGTLPTEIQGAEEKEEKKKEAFIDEAGTVWPAGMKIVNGHLAQSIRAQGMLKEPNEFGYIHIAAEIEMPSPFHKNSAMKAGLLEELKVACKELLELYPGEVQRADVFDAFIIPPGSKEGREVLDKGNYDIHVAEFDTAVLIECVNPDAAVRIRATPDFAKMKGKIDKVARFVHCITCSNAKRIDEVSKETDGVFLFNYFFAADMESKGSEGIDILKSVWEYTAGWWTANANLDNSTPLLPLEGECSQYSLINHCRWNKGLDVFPHLIFRPSLDQFVLKNFTANDIMAMPVLCHLA